MAEKPKCVLAYSGGLDTSVILVWLIEKVRVSVCVECGLVVGWGEYPPNHWARAKGKRGNGTRTRHMVHMVVTPDGDS